MSDTQQTTISAEDRYITLINVFTCPEVRQHELVAALDKAIAEVLVHLPGFISATVHASLDMTRVVNYAQWASVEAYDDMQYDKEVESHMAQIMSIAESADPRLFTVRTVHHA
jgi:type III secretory pathway lipoprotein EscJ